MCVLVVRDCILLYGFRILIWGVDLGNDYFFVKYYRFDLIFVYKKKGV